MDYIKTKNKQEEIAQAITFLSQVLERTNINLNTGTFVSNQTVFDLSEVSAIKDNILLLVDEYIEATSQLTESLTDEQEN